MNENIFDLTTATSATEQTPPPQTPPLRPRFPLIILLAATMPPPTRLQNIFGLSSSGNRRSKSQTL